MKSALVQANSVGATVSGATVTTEIKASGTVQTIDNGGTVTAKDALIAVKGNQMIQIKATDDITEYAKTGSGYKLYKAGTPTLDNGKFKENALYVHNDATVKGAVEIKAGTTAAAGNAAYKDTDLTANTEYTAYVEVDLNEVGAFTNATHSASAKVQLLQQQLAQQ